MKKLILLFALLLLVFTWCSCTDAEEPPIGGDLPSRDEVPQELAPEASAEQEEPPDLTVRTDVTMENVRYEEDYIHYTLINHTDENKTVTMYPYVQKMVDGEWRYIRHTAEGDYVLSVPANGSYDWSVRTSLAYTHTGEFRLILGDYASIEVVTDGEGNRELSFKTDKAYIVGILILTEIDPPDVGTITVRDGLPQNDLFYIENAYYADGRVGFTVVNHSDFSVNYGEKPHVQKKIDGEWVSFGLYTHVNELWGYGVESHGTDHRGFRVEGVSAEALPGEYRLLYGTLENGYNNLWYHFTDEIFYIVGYLTIE